MSRYTTDTDGLEIAARSIDAGGRDTMDLAGIVAAALHTAGDGSDDGGVAAALHDLARGWRAELADLAAEHAAFATSASGAAQSYGEAEAGAQVVMRSPS